MKTRQSIIAASIVGGIILFLTSMLSWKSIYWEGIIVKNFKDEKAVEKVMRDNAPESGVYIMPNYNDSKEMAYTLPVVFTGINLEGKRHVAFVMIASLIAKIMMAFIAVWLLMHHDTIMTYKKKVGFFVLIGLIVSVGAKLSFLIKGYYSFDFAIYSMIVIIIQWFLSGLAMAKILKRR